MDPSIYEYVPDCKLELTDRGKEQARVGVGVGVRVGVVRVGERWRV